MKNWFEIDVDSPEMLMMAIVAQKCRRAVSNTEHELFGIDKLNVVRSSIPAVTHADYPRAPIRARQPFRPAVAVPMFALHGRRGA